MAVRFFVPQEVPVPYLYEVSTLGHFLRRIALDYMRYGYIRWALRHIPTDKDPKAIDRKLVEVYGVTQCRTKRMRQKQKGLAVVQYVRFDHTFVLLATKGSHPAFERIQSYDATLAPLYIGAYSIKVLPQGVSVQVRREVWQYAEARLHRRALYPHAIVERAVNSLPYYRFPGVVAQLRELVTAINHRRRVAGLPRVAFAPPERPFWELHPKDKLRKA